MVDVFISYSRSDHAMVAMLARAVEGEGYDVWWDAELPPHQSYGDVITEKIATARAAIVVWSAEAVKSEWVRAEADMARNQKKLVQTALGPIMPPLPFNQIQFAEIADWRGEPDHPGWRKVKASLADLCGKREPVAGAPAWTPTPAPDASPVAPPATASKAPLFAGIAIALVALAILGGFLLGQRRDRLAAESAPAAASTTLAAPGEAVEILPQSSSRALTAADIAPLGRSQIRLARNEIYARNGRKFRSPDLAAHFARFSWYRPTSFEVTLTPVEQANVAMLARAEDAAPR